MTTVPTPIAPAKAPPQRPGFSLMELLVVVAIITLLIAILVPALGGAKKKAYETNTRAKLAQLSTDCEAYHNIFNAYPGPISPGVTTGSSGKVSGAQNLLLGLSYAVSPTALPVPPAINPVAIPGSSMYVDAGKPTGPVNYGVVNPSGQPEKLDPFFGPKVNELSSLNPTTLTYPPGGIGGTSAAANNVFQFPVILDAYPDALPILYYRKVAGLTSPGFSLNENIEYTNSQGLIAANGQVAVQNKAVPVPPPVKPGIPPMTPELLNAMATGGNQATTPTSVPTLGISFPGFVLISAGPHRTYGYVSTDSTSKADGFVVTGGF